MNKIFSMLVLLFSSTCISQTINESPIPQSCMQMILVLTDSAAAPSGSLCYFENDNGSWKQIDKTIPVVIGRNGLGWGKGLNLFDSSKLPVKSEGDGRSPAGVFELGAAFGYAKSEEMNGVKIPYIPITEDCECVDDINSKYYNQIVYKEETDDADWESSEKMFFADIWYEQGVIVKHNSDPIIDGAGSCIFLHNWSDPDETTSGCTAMEPADMNKIIWWLNSSANPVIVQLTWQLYEDYQQNWKLPLLISRGE